MRLSVTTSDAGLFLNSWVRMAGLESLTRFESMVLAWTMKVGNETETCSNAHDPRLGRASSDKQFFYHTNFLQLNMIHSFVYIDMFS